MVNRKKHCTMVHSVKSYYVYIQHFDPMSSYPGLPFYITVDNCNYQLITRGIKSPHEFLFRFLITALLFGTRYSINMVEARQYLG